MDEEHPRTEASINNRSHLRAILHIEDLYRKNKVGSVAGCWLLSKETSEQCFYSLLTPLLLQAHSQPLKTLLEIVVKHHIKGLKNDKINSNENDPLRSTPPIGLSASSLAETMINSENTDDGAKAFMRSKHINLRYL